MMAVDGSLQRREDDEDPLTEAEERALKQSLLERDKLYATEARQRYYRIHAVGTDEKPKRLRYTVKYGGRSNAKNLSVSSKDAGETWRDI